MLVVGILIGITALSGGPDPASAARSAQQRVTTTAADAGQTNQPRHEHHLSNSPSVTRVGEIGKNLAITATIVALVGGIRRIIYRRAHPLTRERPQGLNVR
jgi:hypothetical protein